MIVLFGVCECCERFSGECVWYDWLDWVSYFVCGEVVFWGEFIKIVFKFFVNGGVFFVFSRCGG